MTVHLLAKVDQNNQLIKDFDFEMVLKLSQDEYIILEDNLEAYVNLNLPDRITAHATVFDLDEAYKRFKASGRNTLVVIGQTQWFIAKAMGFADVVHVTKWVQPLMNPTEPFVKLHRERWKLIHRDAPSDHPQSKPRDWLRSRYQRIG